MGVLNAMLGKASCRSLGAVLCCTLALPALAIETDQYFAWGRPLSDSTDVLNAKVNAEIGLALAKINRRLSRHHKSCHDVTRAILARFRVFLIFHEPELWANNTSLVDRIPGSPAEELEYRKRFLNHDTGPLDTAGWVPPSPTIEVDGVRIGTDKLTHFFSEGWMYFKWYRKAVDSGTPREEAELLVLRRGTLFERTILGMGTSGVLSPADLDSNYQGMLFFRGLCNERDPQLVKDSEGWRLVRPFDFREYVTPEWDESYQPNVYNARRWKKVLPVLKGYCPLLDNPDVQRQRREYRERDRDTPTEAYIRELVEQGKLADPQQFSIEANCEGSGLTF